MSNVDVEMKEEENDEMKADEDENEDLEDEEEEDEDDEVFEKKLKEFNDVLSQNPYDYQTHVDKIEFLKLHAELDALRAARETFAGLYPLTAKLWLDWIKDERNLAQSEEEKVKIKELFDRAVMDYQSVDVWLEYVLFALGDPSSDEKITEARNVFERAIVAVGLDVRQGALIWETYREFEGSILALSSAKNVEKLQKVFKRQLSVPLLDMDKTLEEYETWLGENNLEDKSIKKVYNDALKMLKDREGFEEELLQAENDESKKQEIYSKYIEFELKDGTPPRIQSIFERRITEFCLEPKSWTDYCDYLDKKLKIENISLDVYQRAVRNCTWSGDIWVRYLRCLERYDKPHNEVVLVFEQALNSSLQPAVENLKVWLTYLDYLRRKCDFDAGDIEENNDMRQLRETFGNAVEHLAKLGADENCVVARYWASVEGDRYRDMESARNIWSDIVAVHGDKAQFWLEYVNLEKQFGDSKHIRKLFSRAIDKCTDWPESIGEMWVQFEREEGSLEQLEDCEEKCKKRYKAVAEQREADEKQKKEKIEKKTQKDKDYRREKRRKEAEEKRNSVKRKMDDHDEKEESPKKAMKVEKDDFKVPETPKHDFKKLAIDQSLLTPPPGFKSEKGTSSLPPPPGYKGDIKPPPGFKADITPPPGFKTDITPPPGFKAEVAPPPGFKPNDSIAPPPGFKPEPSSTKQDQPTGNPNEGNQQTGDKNREVFISNLAYDVTEAKIQKHLESSGNIEEVRLPKNFAGKLKGFGYVKFSTPMEARHAMNRDREKLEGRPLFISLNDPKKRHEFQYSTDLEKRKLFIKNLNYSTTKEDLEKVYSEFGALAEIRIVTYRNGHSKGFAYVEFQKEESAKTAVLKTDGMTLHDFQIAVALSNPPKRGGSGAHSSSFSIQSHALGGGAGRDGAGPRGKGRSQVAFVPRSVKMGGATSAAATSGGDQKAAAAAANGNGVGKEENGKGHFGEAKKSNDDFRNLFLKK